MGAFRLLLRSLLYMLGLSIQLSVANRPAGHGEVENHISGNAMFTDVPHDMTAQRGQDVEMACSFRGAGMPSYSLEIQWWYIRNHLEWTDSQPWTTNEVAPEEDMPKDATKISVVKVVGSNISHKLRLSRVKLTDEGTYECRVIDFSDDAGARHHRVRAYLQVVLPGDIIDSTHNNNNFEAADETKRGVAFVDGDNLDSHGSGGREHAHGHHHNHGPHQEHGKHPSSSPAHQGHGGNSQQHKEGKELKKRDVDSNHSHNDCTNEPSCAL